MNRVRRILLGVCVVGLSGLLGCSQKKVAIEDTEMWLSGGESRLQNLTDGCDERGNFSLVGSALNKDLSLDQLRIVALAECVSGFSKYLYTDVTKTDGVEVEDNSELHEGKSSKVMSQFPIGAVTVKIDESFISDKSTGKDFFSSDHKFEFNGENIVVVKSRMSSVSSDTATDCTDDYHVYVKEGLTFQKFLDLLKDNGLPVKILAERLEIWGKVTEGTAELLKDDSVAVEKKAGKVLLEKDAEVNLACYAIIDGSKLKQKDGK